MDIAVSAKSAAKAIKEINDHLQAAVLAAIAGEQYSSHCEEATRLQGRLFRMLPHLARLTAHQRERKTGAC
jgi:hypothetical protein